MSLLAVAGANSVSGGYDIDNSLKFEPDNSEYLYKTNDTGTNRKTFTVSLWTKRTEMSAPIHTYTGSHPYQVLWNGGTNGESTRLGWWGGTPKDALWFDIGGGSGNTGADYRSYSTAVFRDTSAWYHIVVAVDTTQATAANRVKVWVNNEQITTWTAQSLPAQDFQCSLESGIDMRWGAQANTSQHVAGYLAECNYLDGVTATPTDFGEYDSDSGIWKPKAYSGSYGTNGCYLDFSDSSSLGADSSGNGNNFTLNNITSADQATDTPTNSFTTFNDKYWYQNTQVAAEAVVNNGATIWETTRASWWRTGYSNNGVSNGKWYAEFSANTTTFMVGVGSIDRIDGTVNSGPNAHLGASNTAAIGFYAANGNLYENGTTTTNWFSGANSNDILSLALDMDNGYVYLAVNGTWVNSGDPTSGSSGTGGIALTYSSDAYYMGVSAYGSPTYCKANWGGYTEISIASGNADANDYGNFEYAPPSGYYAWCTKNLAEFG